MNNLEKPTRKTLANRAGGLIGFFAGENRRLARLLVALGGATLVLALVSMALASRVRLFHFLLWNIFLAAVPLLPTALLLRSAKRGKKLAAALWGCVWLLTFPNAPYMLTDLVHLRLYTFQSAADATPSPTAWLGLMYVLVAVAVGCVLGCISLYLVHAAVRPHTGRVGGWLFCVMVSLLSGAGIYIGRFMRFNSWDVLVRPHEILLGFFEAMDLEAACFCLLFAGMVLGGYILFYLCFEQGKDPDKY